MGQATLDLPDPLQNSTPAAAGSADDLLAQLAGDEIDRLLAETDGELPPVVSTGLPSAASSAATKDQNASPTSEAHRTETATESAESSSHTTSLFSSERESASEESTDSIPQTGGVDLDAVLEHAANDRQATAQRVALQPSTNAKVLHAPQIELGESARRLPLFLRPLEWISAPLDPWPDQLREIFGKIGLLTLINALAVLAYVLVFRRHH